MKLNAILALVIGFSVVVAYQQCAMSNGESVPSLGPVAQGGTGSDTGSTTGDDPEPIPPPPLVNVAVGKPVTANIAHVAGQSQPAANLTDGNLTTQAYPGTYSFDYTVNLGSFITANKIRLTLMGYGHTTPNVYITSWQVSVFVSGGTETVLASSTSSPGSDFVNVTPNVSFDKVRVKAESIQNWIGIYELEVLIPGT